MRTRFTSLTFLLTGVLSISAVMQMAILNATPKANGTLEAIWESGALNTKKTTKKTGQNLTPQQIQQRRQQALKQQLAQRGQKNTPSKYTREQYQARYKNEQDLKLSRQRTAWKKKWESQQNAKKLAQKKQQPKVAQLKNRSSIQKKITKQVNPKKPPQQLTRAQYQWRFKQEQLKKQKQQQLAQLHSKPGKPQTLANIKTPSHGKPTHATFRRSNTPASYNSLPTEVKNKLRAAKLNEYGMSAYVQEVNSSKPLLAHKDTISRVPASVMKLITSYAALGVLGPNYRWPLDVYTSGTVKNGTLKGDLIIKGYGSPEFDTAALRKVLHSIRQKGIRNVNGRLVFDNSHFSIPTQHAGAFDGKTFASYNAQPDALLYNERISTFNVRASGKRVKVSTSSPAHNLKIVNRMRKVRRGCRPRIGISHRGAQVVATFSGTFSSRCGKRSYSRVISKPAEMIYGSMKAMWKRDVGGTLNARFAMGRAPTNARPLVRTYSRTLAQILPTIDKESNNVMARQVLLSIGAKHFGGQGTPRKGANAISSWLNSRGLNFPELRIENGSGLSRHARISARHIGDLLVDAHKSPYRNVLMQSLAVAGVDGTMKRRLRGTPVRGRGFFKTGTLRDVRSIAGYVKASNGKTYAIAILHNDPKARRRGLAVHDKLIEWVYHGGRSNARVAIR